jgi:hypothetical protein
VIVGTGDGVAVGRAGGCAGCVRCASAGAESTDIAVTGANTATATALINPNLERTMFPCLIARSRNIVIVVFDCQQFARIHRHLQASRLIGHGAFHRDESHGLVTPGRDTPKREA